jgi:hypothetical protein
MLWSAIALDLTASSAALPARALRGPVASLAAVCTMLRHIDGEPPLAPERCSFDRADACGGLPRASDGRPFRALQFVRLANECFVAVRAERGWFVGDTSLGTSDRHDSGVTAIERHASHVVVRTINQYWWHEAALPFAGWYDRREGLFVCGLVDGLPACTDEVVVGWAPRWEREDGDAKPHTWRWRYRATVDDEALTIRRLIDNPRAPSSYLRPLLPPRAPTPGRTLLRSLGFE